LWYAVTAEKPRIVDGPKDVLIQENSDVFFHCRASGEPEPTIIWKKVDDQMPQGRSVYDKCFLSCVPPRCTKTHQRPVYQLPIIRCGTIRAFAL